MLNKIRDRINAIQELEERSRSLDEREKEIEAREASISKDQVDTNKSIEYYSQSYASFYSTAMEKDKSILTLSTAGLGFLVTFVGVSSALPNWGYVLLVPASLAFLIAIYLVVEIFGTNSQYISAILTDEDHRPIEFSLRCMDRWAIRCFYVGILCSFTLGMSVSINSGYIEMSKDKKESNEKVVVQESYAGADKLMKSMAGAAVLKPAAPAQQTSAQSNNKDKPSSEAKKQQ